MSIKKLEDGRFEVDVRPRGRNGKRIRKKFDRKADAHCYERSIIARYQNNDYLNRPADKRRLSEFIETWWMLLGRNLPYAKYRLSTVNGICRDMNDPMMYQIDSRCLIDYRCLRLENGIKASTINHDLFALSGIFKAMGAIDEFYGENHVATLAPLREVKSEMSYLTENEINTLLGSVKGDYYRIAVLCLATGARWGRLTDSRQNISSTTTLCFLIPKTGKSALFQSRRRWLILLKRTSQGGCSKSVTAVFAK